VESGAIPRRFSDGGLPREAAAELPDLPPLLRADRAYQIAAANFYSTNFDEAKQQFEAIARDKESPYHVIAPYMAARAMLRKGSFAEKEDEGRPFLNDAETRLGSILKDSSLKTSHHAAGRLFNLARLRAHPEEKLHELAHEIMKKDASQDFKQGVWDYTILMDKYVEVEDEAAVGRREGAEVGEVGVAAGLHAQPRHRGPRQVRRHHRGRAAEERERRGQHPPVPDRHQLGQPRLRLTMQRLHGIGPRARGRPVGVACSWRAASSFAAALGVLAVFEAGDTVGWTGHRWDGRRFFGEL